MQTYKSSSNIKPKPIDTVSSFVVYVNRDVIQEERKDVITGETEIVYNYTVDEYTKLEWNEMELKSAQIQITEQDIEQITQGQMITDMDLRLIEIGG